MGERADRAGDEPCDAVTEAMVALHERYHGRAPATARTQMLGDDLLACLLGDIYTDVEKTMIELQRKAMVHETRSAFQQAMEHRFIDVIETVTRRKVLAVHLHAPRRTRSRARAVRARELIREFLPAARGSHRR